MTGFFFDTLAFGSIVLQDSGFMGGGTYKGYMAMLVKYDSSGNVLWARKASQAGKLGVSVSSSVALDNAGNVYIAGYFIDSVSFGPFTLTESSTQGNIFVVKYNQAGTVQWVTSAVNASPVSHCQANSIALDALGNVYITGSFDDTISFGATTLRATASSSDVFLAKLDPSGNPLWAKQAIISGPFCFATGYSVAIDASGNPYMAGSFINLFKLGALTLNSTEGDMFVAKYDASGNVLWANQSQSGSNSNNGAGGSSMCIDGAGGIYVTGSFYGNTSFGSIKLATTANHNQPFLAKYSSSGGLLWAKQGITSDNNTWYGFSLASDTLNNGGGFMVIGAASGGNPPYIMNIGADTFKLNSAFQSATILLKFDSAGNTLCGEIYSEGDEDDGDGVSVDRAGKHIYIGGDLDTTTVFGPDTLANAGPFRGEQPYVARWKDCCGFKAAVTGAGSICKGDSIKLIAGGGGTYLWNTGATSSAIVVSPNTTSTYTANVSLGSCTQAATVNVTVNPVPLPVLNTRKSICAGETVTLSASGATSYSWSPAIGLNCTTCPSPIANPTITTEYILTLTDGPCIVKDSTLVIVNPIPALTACCNTTIPFGQSVQLTSSGGASYSWSPVLGLSCDTCANPVASPLVNTTYTLTITSDSGCTAQQTITIDVTCGTLFIPDAFSPNNDGQNDVLYVRDDCIKTLQFEIFDRWGNKVFETNDKTNGWNGMHKGQAMNTGTYVYYLKATMYDGTTQEKKGNVTLVR